MILDLIIGLATGILVGGLFFGGLRWTVLRLPTARRPVQLAWLSLLARTVAAVVILASVIWGHPLRGLAALVGLVAVRTLLVWAARRWIGAQDGEET